MHPDIFTPRTYLILFLICLATDAPLTVKHIFEDNLNWDGFCLAEKDNLREVEIKEVNKMLFCKDESHGFFTYECESCGTQKQSTLDATVASARIVARITQINGRNLSKAHYSMCLTDMWCSRFRLLCGPL